MSIAVGTTTAQTPLQANFGGLKKVVAAYVQGANITSILNDAGASLNAAIDKINTKEWNWLNREVTLSLANDTRTITIPANFKKPRKLTKRDTNGKTVGRYIFQIPKEFANSDWNDVNSGSPMHYTVRNPSDDRLLTFSVPPTSSFVTTWPTARMTYKARMQHFSDGNDTLGDLGVPPELRNFLVWYARWEIATIRSTPTQVGNALSAWRSEWGSLIADDTNEQTDF